MKERPTLEVNVILMRDGENVVTLVGLNGADNVAVGLAEGDLEAAE